MKHLPALSLETLKKYGSKPVVGFTVINHLDELCAESIKNAPLITGFPVPLPLVLLCVKTARWICIAGSAIQRLVGSLLIIHSQMKKLLIVPASNVFS